MSRVYNLKQFIDKSSALHGGKYDYSKFIYVNARSPSWIACPYHGDFEQSPDQHTRKGAIGCPSCVVVKKSSNANALRLKIPEEKKSGVGHPRAISREDYRRRLEEKYGEKFSFDLSSYSLLTQSFVTLHCQEHGHSRYSAPSLLMGKYGCRKCGEKASLHAKIKTWDSLIESCNNLPESVKIEQTQAGFVNRNSEVKVVCGKHGVSIKKAKKLLAGQSCERCRLEVAVKEGLLPGGYCRTIFQRKPELATTEATLYYLSVGPFYKVGITARNTRQRVSSIRCRVAPLGYKVQVIHELKMNLMLAYELEQRLLEKFASSRVVEAWSTELFKVDVLKGKTLKDEVDLIQRTLTNT